MGKMKEFFMGAAELFQEYHPVYDLEECMNIIDSLPYDTIYWMKYQMVMERRIRSGQFCKICLFVTESGRQKFFEDFRDHIETYSSIFDKFNDSMIFFKDDGETLTIYFMDDDRDSFVFFMNIMNVGEEGKYGSIIYSTAPSPEVLEK